MSEAVREAVKAAMEASLDASAYSHMQAEDGIYVNDGYLSPSVIATAALSALSKAGFAVVPVNPSSKMVYAGQDVLIHCGNNVMEGEVADAYAAMIAAGGVG